MLVLLRITLGWHFLYAGLWKLSEPDFSSESFLAQAKGPLMDDFQRLVPDFPGLERLDEERQREALDARYKQFASQHDLTEDQQAQGEALLAWAKERVQILFFAEAETATALEEYRHEWSRLDELKASSERSVPYMQKRIWDTQTKPRDQSAAWLDELETIHAEFDSGLEDLLDAQQRGGGNAITEPFYANITMDEFIIYTNIAIGGCLIVGLFTRLAALGGALFMLLIVLSQPDWPGMYPEPHPSAGRALIVTKEFIEMMALFSLACLPVGRWGGLDFFIHYLIVRPIFGSKERE